MNMSYEFVEIKMGKKTRKVNIDTIKRIALFKKIKYLIKRGTNDIHQNNNQQ